MRRTIEKILTVSITRCYTCLVEEIRILEKFAHNCTHLNKYNSLIVRRLEKKLMQQVLFKEEK
jgi:hypothetical protein